MLAPFLCATAATLLACSVIASQHLQVCTESTDSHNNTVFGNIQALNKSTHAIEESVFQQMCAIKTNPSKQLASDANRNLFSLDRPTNSTWLQTSLQSTRSALSPELTSDDLTLSPRSLPCRPPLQHLHKRSPIPGNACFGCANGKGRREYDKEKWITSQVNAIRDEKLKRHDAIEAELAASNPGLSDAERAVKEQELAILHFELWQGQPRNGD